ncbi:MAG TPA: hypothetical protein VHB02_02975 [Acidimicrobiales bacterium]|nr:hypothetical protein [Acidimicrobiales bacterium]
MPSSVGKRQREQQKLERARAKAERKVARQSMPTEFPAVPVDRTEAELIEELRVLRQAFEAGEVSAEDFEERQDHLQAQFDQLQ